MNLYEHLDIINLEWIWSLSIMDKIDKISVVTVRLPSVDTYQEPNTFQQNSDIVVEASVPYGVHISNPDNRRSPRSRNHHHKVLFWLNWNRVFDRSTENSYWIFRNWFCFSSKHSSRCVNSYAKLLICAMIQNMNTDRCHTMKSDVEVPLHITKILCERG